VKKIVSVIVVVVVLLSVLSVASCAFTGVSQEEYDKVVAELDEVKTQAQVTSLQSELSEVEAKNQSFKEMLAKAAVYAEAIRAANAMSEETTEEESMAVWNKKKVWKEKQLRKRQWLLGWSG
jgi:CHASE3 domain sensor protein